ERDPRPLGSRSSWTGMAAHRSLSPARASNPPSAVIGSRPRNSTHRGAGRASAARAAGAQIPFNRPHLVGRELAYIAEAVARGNTAGDGRFSRDCCRLLAERFGMTNVLLTTSCTAALEMAALLSAFQPGDEVVMPAFTYVS